MYMTRICSKISQQDFFLCMIFFSFFLLASSTSLKNLRFITSFFRKQFEVADGICRGHREKDEQGRDGPSFLYFLDGMVGREEHFKVRTNRSVYHAASNGTNILVARLSADTISENNFWGVFG